MASPNTARKEVTSSNDLYNTPIEALEAAWAAGIFDQFLHYHDPCNGLGEIANFLNTHGKKCTAADIIDYQNFALVEDFLLTNTAHLASCLVFNPPFLLTEEFIDHALTLCDHVIMFNRATVLETKDRSRKHNEKEWPLKTFYSMANRVSCTKGVDREYTANSVWYGWYVYDKNYKGNPEIKWLFTK
jgi:hypothetical protein